MIWKRYILKEFIKVFFLFLFCFYFLYVVIDYSIHMQDYLQGKGVPLFKIFHYYSLQFIKRADILIPLALLVGTIKTLCNLNTHRELLALQSAGIALKRLISPIFFIAWLCCFSIFAINEFAIPHSLNFIDRFYDAHLRHSYRGQRTEPLHVLHLDDHSRLVYQYFDTSKDAFFDVIWLKSPDDIWKIKYLKATASQPEGQWVDHLIRTEGGKFEKHDSFPSYVFNDLSWSYDLPSKGYIPFENRSITDLWNLFSKDSLLSIYQKQEVLTQLIYKLIAPFLCLIALIAIAPFCLAFSRDLPQFFIYSLGIFGFVSFIAYLDAALILGENATLSPLISMVAPFALLSLIFGWKFAKC